MHIPALSVVIPTCGNIRTLPKLLASIAQQRVVGGYELIFVENLAGDISSKQRDEILANDHCKILTAGVRGANAARNLGLAHSQAETVLFLDDDCECPHVAYFQAVIDAHRAAPEFCALGGLYLNPPKLKWLARTYQAIARYWLLTSKTATGEQLQLIGGCVSYKRAMLQSANLEFDPKIVFGGTETDLHERMQLCGLRLKLEPSLSNIHHCEVSMPAFVRKSFLQGVGHTQRSKQRPRPPLQLSRNRERPHGLAVLLYDLAFFSGKYWSSGQDDYAYPTSRQMFTKIMAESPSFLLHWLELDREGLYWRWRRYSSASYLFLNRHYWRAHNYNGTARIAVQGKLTTWFWQAKAGLHYLRWKPKALLADFKWRLINYKNDLKFAWLGYGNHRVFERFPLKPLLPPKYFSADEIVRLGAAELENLDDEKLAILAAQGQPVFLQLGLTPCSTPLEKKIVSTQKYLSGILLTLDNNFDFRRVAPVWASIDLPIYLEAHSPLEDIDSVYDHVKNVFYMGQNQSPKTIYSSPILPTAPNSPPIERTLRKTLPVGTPRFSFIIPVYNNTDYIAKVLEHIEAINAPRSDWEIVVIDDGSEHCVLEIIEAWMNSKSTINLTAIRWSREFHDGTRDDTFRAGRARRLGVEAARGEHLVFLDSDILLPPDFLSEVSRLLETYDVIQLRRQMVKQKSLAELKYTQIESSDIYRESSYWEDFKRAESWPSLRNHWKYTCTYCLVMSKSAYTQTGGFKHCFNTYGFEDVDIGYRLSQLGQKFHLSKMAALHLFPVPTDHSTHFDPQRRGRSLAASCRRFYLINLDPEIYRDLYTVLRPPTSAVFTTIRWLGAKGRKAFKPILTRAWPRAQHTSLN